MILKRTILFALVTLMLTAQTAYTVSYGFEVSGSRRVPTYVPRDLNLRDPQPVRTRIIKIEEAYEREAINQDDNRNIFKKIFNPRGSVKYVTKHNCYSQREPVKQCIFKGYIVTHKVFGKNVQTFTPNRPRGKYFTIMSNSP